MPRDNPQWYDPDFNWLDESVADYKKQYGWNVPTLGKIAAESSREFGDKLVSQHANPAGLPAAGTKTPGGATGPNINVNVGPQASDFDAWLTKLYAGSRQPIGPHWGSTSMGPGISANYPREHPAFYDIPPERTPGQTAEDFASMMNILRGGPPRGPSLAETEISTSYPRIGMRWSGRGLMSPGERWISRASGPGTYDMPTAGWEPVHLGDVRSATRGEYVPGTQENMEKQLSAILGHAEKYMESGDTMRANAMKNLAEIYKAQMAATAGERQSASDIMRSVLGETIRGKYGLAQAYQVVQGKATKISESLGASVLKLVDEAMKGVNLQAGTPAYEAYRNQRKAEAFREILGNEEAKKISTSIHSAIPSYEGEEGFNIEQGVAKRWKAVIDRATGRLKWQRIPYGREPE